MAFEARVYIQGVGVYVPNDARNDLIVLFPRSDRAEKPGEKPFPPHYPIVQYRAGYRDGQASFREWITHEINGCWVGFSAEGKVEPFRIAPPLGLPALEGAIAHGNLLSGQQASVSQALPGASDIGSKLAAGVYIDRGVLSPSEEYKSKFKFAAPNGGRVEEQFFSSVIKVELGEVDSFALHRTVWKTGQTDFIEFASGYDELEVWIRHFDNKKPPDPDAECPEQKADRVFDEDFALNYWVLDDVKKLLKFPVPEVVLPWAKGGPIGGCARQCMACTFQTTGFNVPLDVSKSKKADNW